MNQTKIIAVISVVCACGRRFICERGYDSRRNNTDSKYCQRLQLEDRGRQKLRSEARSGRLG